MDAISCARLGNTNHLSTLAGAVFCLSLVFLPWSEWPLLVEFGSRPGNGDDGNHPCESWHPRSQGLLSSLGSFAVVKREERETRWLAVRTFRSLACAVARAGTDRLTRTCPGGSWHPEARSGVVLSVLCWPLPSAGANRPGCVCVCHSNTHHRVCLVDPSKDVFGKDVPCWPWHSSNAGTGCLW